MKKFYVYVHVCPNGKRYVGCTKQARPELRWKEGKGYQTNKHFYSAIKKYGWSSIKHEAWELTCESEMYYAEKYLIAYYHTTESKFGYNHSSGGEKSFLGCKHSEEAKRRMSEIQKKVHSDPEYRKKLSEAHKGKPCKPWSEEARKHLSEAKKGKSHKPASEETRKKLSKARKEKWSDPEYRKKLSEAHKNRPKVKIKLPDGTIREMAKNSIIQHYVNKGKKFEYVS